MTKPESVEVSVETLRRWLAWEARQETADEISALLPCSHELIELDNCFALSRSVRHGETARCQNCKTLVVVTWSALDERTTQ